MKMRALQKYNTQRLHITVNGIVQGVGFRPFVFHLSKGLGLTGFARNTSDGVDIEVEGSTEGITLFQQKLIESAPPLSEITEVKTNSVPIKHSQDFTICASPAGTNHTTLISPDICICEDCLNELFDRSNRRYLYPFINCTNCGPRYTIIDGVPYDRPLTAMRDFTMCPECQAEYDDPANRRFHAQPNACPECGPHLWFESSNESKGDETGHTDEAIAKAVEALLSGKVVAIKGLGGFHLAVDAAQESAVCRLRQRKAREEKPLAVMVLDIKTAHTLAELNPYEEQLLLGPGRPIVLVKKRPEHHLADSIAPGSERFGIMLPYTPIHFILLHQFSKNSYSPAGALVMTSGNLSGEPIVLENAEAKIRLSQIADSFLMHNRDILIRVDDSVVIHLKEKTRFLRRSRGFVPRPVFVKSDGPPVLAVGGELKNTICLLKKDKAFLSQHIGDLENAEAYDFFQSTISRMKRTLQTKPELIVHDLHPHYLSTRWAKEQTGTPILAVQHHHAHLSACMAECGLSQPVIGLIMDGTGYGLDGTIWGGEVLIGDFINCRRYAYFEPFPLPGGDAAIRAPWRTAVSYLYQAFDGHPPELPFMREHPVKQIIEMVAKKINSPMTSSCGRLFDAVAAMSGGRQVVKYEAQAAIELMQAADSFECKPFEFGALKRDGQCTILLTPIIRSIAKAISEGESLSRISTRFHRTLIELFKSAILSAKTFSGIKYVVLSGGVFQNELLFNGLIPVLEKSGLKVFTHTQVPCNDGGLSLGQAMIARMKSIN